MNSNLKGTPCHVYPYTYSDVPSGTTVTNTHINSIIENNNHFDYFLGIPLCDPTDWTAMSSQYYLYDPDFSSVTAAAFDLYTYGWQWESMLYVVGDGYTGEVDTDECLGLWANKLNLKSYADDTSIRGLIFHFYEIPDYAYNFEFASNRVSPSTSGAAYRLFKLSTGSTVQIDLFSGLYFGGNSSYPTVCNTVKTCFPTITSDRKLYRYAGIGNTGSVYRNTICYASKGTGNVIFDEFWWNLEDDYIPPETPTDPYTPPGGGGSGGGGGGGNRGGGGTGGEGDEPSDPVDIPALPGKSASDSGFVTVYAPTVAQLKSLAIYMWGTLDLTNWKKIFADPMDAILGLSIVPVAVAGTAQAVTIGNINTGVTMNKADSQYAVVDCGSIDIDEYWGSYLDYTPYTKIEVYLPYIGTRELVTDDVMGLTIQLVYHIDILSGACVAFIKCGDHVLYSFSGQCAAAIPVTGVGFDNVINSMISIAASAGMAIATGGATAPTAAASVAANSINMLKPNVEKTNNVSSMAGLLAIQTPYVIITRPHMCLPENQNRYTAYPAEITVSIGSLTGYTEMDKVILSGIPGTESELKEIENLLKSGVIL